jgi:hypothetical protein
MGDAPLKPLSRLGLRRDRAGSGSFAVLAVLLLLMASCSIALMEASLRGGAVEEGPSLLEAERELRSLLDEALDDALARAVPVAAMEEGVDLGEALDAVLAPLVRQGLPAASGGWRVEMIEARGGLGPGKSGTRSPWAVLEVELTGGVRGPPVVMSVTAEGPPGPWSWLVSRAASAVLGLRGAGGPVALAAADALWRDAQATAFSGTRDVSDLVTAEEVEAALRASLEALGTGGTPLPAGPPALDLEALVGQSVAGLVERHLGWVAGYALGDLDVGPAARLRSEAADGLARVVVSALEELVGGELPTIEGEDLEEVVTLGLAVIDVLEGSMDAGRCSRGVRSWLDACVPALPGPVKGFMVNALTTTAMAAGRLGLACARDAVLSMGLLGRQVDGAADQVSDALPGPTVRLGGLHVSTAWSGSKATEPPDLLSSLGEDGGLGSLPFTSTCLVSVTGDAEFQVSSPGASGGPVLVSWRVPVDLGWEVTLVTGRPLEGVRYAPSATLAGDLARVADAVWARAAGSVGWLTARFRDAAEAGAAWGSSLLSDMRETLMTESAYTLARALWSIGDTLLDNATGKALNGTWDLFSDLFGDDIRDAMTWGFDLFGARLEVALDPLRQQVLVSLTRGHVSLELTARRLCDPHPPFRARPVEGYYWGVFGEARLEAEGRWAVLHFDPLTLERASVLTMEVSWGSQDEGGSLVVEALEARELEDGWSLSLSDLPGTGWLLGVAGGGVADAGLALHGDALEEGAARKALEGALKDALLATVRGWKVGDLLGETGRGPDADTFVETLMRELHAALVERGEDLVRELEVFLEVAFPTPGWPSVRLSLVLSEPMEALLPLAAWARRSLEDLLGGALSGSVEGAGRGLSSWLAEHLAVRFELAWDVEPPAWLASRAGVAPPEGLGLVVRGEANAAALAAAFGRDLGVWSTSVEVMLRGVPGALLDLVPGMGCPEWDWAEVTLARVTVEELAAERLLVSQVLYDTPGRDADLEYVELVNAGRRMLDLEGYSLRDANSGFIVQCHVPVLPGDHVLVVRNSSAVRGRWGVVPDVGRMGLRLANDGDMVTLVDPSGLVLDTVAWEGCLEGWEGLEAGEGTALMRRAGDDRAGCPSSWYVGEPCPRRSGW